MRIQPGVLIGLGYGEFVRPDEVTPVESITHDRGPGWRSWVRLRGVAEPIVASQADTPIADDLVTPPDEAGRMPEFRTTLSRVAGAVPDSRVALLTVCLPLAATRQGQLGGEP